MIVRAWGVWAVVALLAAAAARAEEVTFSLPPDHADAAVTWAATPLNLPPDADVLQSMVMETEARSGPWLVTLDPGPYVVTAFSGADLFELEVTVTAGAAQSYEVPPLSLSTEIPFRCTEGASCDFVDAETGLAFTLPQGWAAERPYRFDEGGGPQTEALSAVFFEDIEGEGANVWFLNPPEWDVEESGPCRDHALGALCTFDLTPGAEAAYGVIAPSLHRAAAP